MGFVAPAALLVGAALLAIVVATYLLRPRRPTRRVSSTFLWLAALNDLQAARPWRRVPPSVLLLLQILALAGLIGALARPYVLSTESGGPFSVVLVDASASMQATDVQPSRFEAARRRAGQLVDALAAGQQMGLVSLDAEPRVLAPPTNDRAALHRALDALQLTSESANLSAAVSVAGTLVEGHADAQIAVISDGSLDRSQVPPNAPAPVRFYGVGSASPDNLAVASFGTRTNQGQTSALARVVNYGQQPQTASLTLKVDGARFDARSLSVPAGGSADAQWDNVPPAAHTLEAQIDRADDLALDNSAWSVLGGDRPTRVLLVTDGNVFLERALALRPSTQVTRVSPGDYSARGQNVFDLVVFDGFAPPTLPTGSSVLMLHPPANNGIVSAGPDLQISAVTASRDGDPLLADVPLSSVHVSRSRRLERAPWSDTVIQSPETPLLLVGEQAGHRVAVVGFDIHQSDLPLQPGFPVLVQHLLDWLVPTSSTATPVVQVGDTVALAPLPEAVAVDVHKPDGTVVHAAPPLPAPPFTGADQPGLYTVVQRDGVGRETSSVFAANFLNAHESALASATDSGAPPVGPRREPLKAPQEFWPILAGLALLALLVEAALAWWQFAAATLRARIALALRSATAIAVVLALLDVGFPQRVNRQAVVFVTDVSASVADAQARRGALCISRHRHPSTGRCLRRGRCRAYRPGPPGTDPRRCRRYPAVEHVARRRYRSGRRAAPRCQPAAGRLPTARRAAFRRTGDQRRRRGASTRKCRRAASKSTWSRCPAPRAPRRWWTACPRRMPSTRANAFQRGRATGHQHRNRWNAARHRQRAATGRPGRQPQSGRDRPQLQRPGAIRPACSTCAPRSTPTQDTMPQNNAARAVVEVQGPPRVLVVEQRDGEGASDRSRRSPAPACRSKRDRWPRCPTTSRRSAATPPSSSPTSRPRA